MRRLSGDSLYAPSQLSDIKAESILRFFNLDFSPYFVKPSPPTAFMLP